MKNLKIVLAFMMLATFIVSCDDDGGTSVVDVKEGAIPNFTFSDTKPTIIDLNLVSAGNHMEFGYSVDIFQGNVSSADVVGFYKTAGGDVYGPVTFESDITTFPADSQALFLFLNEIFGPSFLKNMLVEMHGWV